MKHVWFIQDFNNMEVNEVYTTKKAAVAEVKNIYGKGRFHTITKGRIYEYFTPDPEDKADNPACTIWRVPCYGQFYKKLKTIIVKAKKK